MEVNFETNYEGKHKWFDNAKGELKLGYLYAGSPNFPFIGPYSL